MGSVIFVCTGNLCRSPMAEGILRKRVDDIGRTDVQVSSMGIHGLERQGAAGLAVEVCSEHGIDISEHRSRPLIPGELKQADLILVMELVQKEFIRVFFPQVIEKTFLLGSWPDRETRKGIIKDPMGGSLADYRKTFAAIDGHIERIFPFVLS